MYHLNCSSTRVIPRPPPHHRMRILFVLRVVQVPPLCTGMCSLVSAWPSYCLQKGLVLHLQTQQSKCRVFLCCSVWESFFLCSNLPGERLLFSLWHPHSGCIIPRGLGLSHQLPLWVHHQHSVFHFYAPCVRGTLGLDYKWWKPHIKWLTCQ